MTRDALLKKFEQAMFDIYRRAKAEAKYNATIFRNMLSSEGGLLTAKKLINADKQSDGYTALMLANRLDLTVEALIVEDQQWRSLFTTEEIERAKKRLLSNGYKFRGED